MTDPDPFAVVLWPIDRLQPHPDNPNQGDVGAVATAIAVDGWHGTTIAQERPDEDPRLIVGHTRWRALQFIQRDGFTIAGYHFSYDELAERVLLPPPGVIPLQLLAVDDVRSARKLLADNRGSALATTDEAAELALLTALAEHDALLGSLYDGDDVDDRARILESLQSTPIDPRDAWKGMPGYDQKDRDSVFSTTVHFRTPEDADRFFAEIERPKKKSFWWPVEDNHVGSDVHQQYVGTE